MKKIIFALSTVCLLFASCTGNDDENNTNESGVLLKKTVEVDSDGDAFVRNYNYDGNKLVDLSDEDGKIVFTYTGNLITKMDYKDVNGVSYQVDTFTYENDKLMSYVSIEPLEQVGRKEVYVYNSDGTVNINTFSGNLTSQTQAGGTGKVFFANGEISKIQTTIGLVTETTNYTYDSKNNPQKNILGLDKLAFINGEGDGVLRNILSEVFVSEDYTDTFTYQYTYTPANYPATSVETYEGDITTTTYFY